VRSRLVGSALLIALLAVLALGIPLGVVGSSRARDDVIGNLEREARSVAILVEGAVERGRPIPTERIAHVAAGHAVAITMPESPAERIGPAVPGEALGASAAVAGGGRVTVTVTAPAGLADEDAQEVWMAVVLLGLGAFIVAAGLALWLARRLSAPLEALAESSAHLGRPEFTVGDARGSVPEVRALATALERRADQIAELLARERAFSSNVAHQLRTPLTACRCASKSSRRATRPPRGTRRAPPSSRWSV
jgi:methyl-accepting chemotaxis protein